MVFLGQIGAIITGYDFLWARRVIWAMFKPIPTLPNFTFGQLFMWIDLISLNKGKLEQIITWPNFTSIFYVNWGK